MCGDSVFVIIRRVHLVIAALCVAALIGGVAAVRYAPEEAVAAAAMDWGISFQQKGKTRLPMSRPIT
jgi:hypothetical protein